MRIYGTMLLAAAALAPCATGAAEPSPVAAASGAAADRAPDPAEPLLRIAALKSPELLNEELKIAQADAFRFRGWRQYMPYLNANWGLGYFGLLASDEPRSQVGSGQIGGSFTLSANYPIYAWGAIEAEKKFTFARENAVRARAVVRWRDLAQSVRGTFCDAVVCKLNIALLAKRFEGAKRTAARAEQEFSLGRIVVADRAAALLLSREAGLKFDNEKIRFAGLLATLRGLTGAEDFAAADIPDDLPDIGWDDAVLAAQLDAFKKSGVDSTPEVAGAGYERDMYRQQRVMVEARELPVFNLGTSLTQQPIQTNGTFGMQTVVFAGVTGSWNIFDRDTTKESIRAQIIGERLVETRLKFATRQRLEDLDAALQKLKANREAIALRRDLVKLRGEALALARQRRDLGLAGPDDLDRAEIELLDSKLALTTNRAEILKAYHAFMSGLQLSPSDNLYSAPTNER